MNRIKHLVCFGIFLLIFAVSLGLTSKDNRKLVAGQFIGTESFSPPPDGSFTQPPPPEGSFDTQQTFPSYTDDSFNIQPSFQDPNQQTTFPSFPSESEYTQPSFQEPFQQPSFPTDTYTQPTYPETQPTFPETNTQTQFPSSSDGGTQNTFGTSSTNPEPTGSFWGDTNTATQPATAPTGTQLFNQTNTSSPTGTNGSTDATHNTQTPSQWPSFGTQDDPATSPEQNSFSDLWGAPAATQQGMQDPNMPRTGIMEEMNGLRENEQDFGMFGSSSMPAGMENLTEEERNMMQGMTPDEMEQRRADEGVAEPATFNRLELMQQRRKQKTQIPAPFGNSDSNLDNSFNDFNFNADRNRHPEGDFNSFDEGFFGSSEENNFQDNFNNELENTQNPFGFFQPPEPIQFNDWNNKASEDGTFQFKPFWQRDFEEDTFSDEEFSEEEMQVKMQEREQMKVKFEEKRKKVEKEEEEHDVEMDKFLENLFASTEQENENDDFDFNPNQDFNVQKDTGNLTKPKGQSVDDIIKKTIEAMEKQIEEVVKNRVKQLEQQYEETLGEILSSKVAETIAIQEELSLMEAAVSGGTKREEKAYTVIEDNIQIASNEVKWKIKQGTIIEKVDSASKKEEIIMSKPVLITKSENLSKNVDTKVGKAVDAVNNNNVKAAIIEIPQVEKTKTTETTNESSTVPINESKKSGLRLNQPATLTVAFEAKDKEEDALAIGYDSITGEIKGTFPVSVENGEATLEADVATVFVIMSVEDAEDLGYIEPTPTFEDVKDDYEWSKEHVDTLAKLQVLKGKSKGKFEPGLTITRAELTKIALKTFGFSIDEEKKLNGFKDFTESHWAGATARRAKETGIVAGYEDGTFKPDKPVTRAEAIKVLLGAAQITPNVKAKSTFEDVDESQWYAPYVSYATSNNIVSGYPDGTFGPSKSITRAAASKIANNIRKLKKEINKAVSVNYAQPQTIANNFADKVTIAAQPDTNQEKTAEQPLWKRIATQMEQMIRYASASIFELMPL